MKPSRELDALVAEKVMGWYYIDHPYPENLWVEPGKRTTFFPPHFKWSMEEEKKMPGISNGISCPDYSTDIQAAWQVVEKLKENKDHLTKITIGTILSSWLVAVEVDDKGYFMAHEHSAPHAICLAALKAVGHLK